MRASGMIANLARTLVPLTFDDTCTTTVLTLIFNDLAFTTTGRTDTLTLHQSEQTLCRAGYHTTTMTGGTGLTATAFLGACALTVLTDDILLYLKLLGNTRRNLLQVKTNFQSEV